MNIVEPSVELITEQDPIKKIEMVGRTCYKSTSEMTKESALKFYGNLIQRSHYAMLEHTTFVFEVSPLYITRIMTALNLRGFMSNTEEHNFLTVTGANLGNEYRYLVSGNLRALNEHPIPELLTALYVKDPALVYTPKAWILYDDCIKDVKVVEFCSLRSLQRHEIMAHFRPSFRVVCDRGVTHEMVRHRPASYAQESTRYCNYGSARFGGVSFILPCDFEEWADEAQEVYKEALAFCEKSYLRLLELNIPPQKARGVLATALKTEIIMTANGAEFEHFFDLRSRGTTGAPHPDMKVIADKALDIYRQEVNKLLSK